MDTRLYRWFSNQGNYRRRRWYHHPVSQWCNTVLPGKHCTNYRADSEALKQATILVKDSLEPCSPTVFLTDALSVLEALQTNKSTLLATQMQELGNTCRIVLQWIPAHCGIPGNELAKCGRQEEQPSTSIHYQEKTTIIKTALKPRQERRVPVVREGHQTTEYVLQGCNRHQPERIAQWPSATLLHQKLYGGLENLKMTTNFITAAGLVV